MKYLLLVLVQCGLVFGIGSAVADGYLDLTSADGNTVRAKVLRYNKSSDMVLIERENRKRYTVSPDIFCDADKGMIRNWELVERFMSDSGLKVSIERIEKKQHEEKKQRGKQTVQSWISSVYYKIAVDNCTDLAFDNIKIEIIPFVQYEEFYPDRSVDQRFKTPADILPFDIGTIKAKGNEEVSTHQVGSGMESAMATEGSRVVWKNIGADFRGVWIRITMELPGGAEVMREIKNPEDLWTGIEWSDATQTIDLKTMKTYESLKDYLDYSKH